MTTAVLEIAAGHFSTSFNVCPAKIYFDWLKLLFICNGRAINNLQESPVFKKWPIDFWSLFQLLLYLWQSPLDHSEKVLLMFRLMEHWLMFLTQFSTVLVVFWLLPLAAKPMQQKTSQFIGVTHNVGNLIFS